MRLENGFGCRSWPVRLWRADRRLKRWGGVLVRDGKSSVSRPIAVILYR
jgi:hypothetical protein